MSSIVASGSQNTPLMDGIVTAHTKFDPVIVPR